MIPRMTQEEKVIEKRYRRYEKMRYLSMYKRWIVEAIVTCFLALTQIIDLYKKIKGEISHE